MVPELLNFAHELKAAGLTVIMPTEPEGEQYNWINYTDGQTFASVSWNSYDGVTYSRRHKPGPHGTGVRVSDRHAELTTDAARAALRYPAWFSTRERAQVQQYRDADDYINSTLNKWCKPYIL